MPSTPFGSSASRSSISFSLPTPPDAITERLYGVGWGSRMWGYYLCGAHCLQLKMRFWEGPWNPRCDLTDFDWILAWTSEDLEDWHCQSDAICFDVGEGSYKQVLFKSPTLIVESVWSRDTKRKLPGLVIAISESHFDFPLGVESSKQWSRHRIRPVIFDVGAIWSLMPPTVILEPVCNRDTERKLPVWGIGIFRCQCCFAFLLGEDSGQPWF